MAFGNGFGSKQNTILCGCGQDYFSLKIASGNASVIASKSDCGERRGHGRGRNDDTGMIKKIVHSKAIRGFA
jgi:hypothetical protein